MNYFNKLCFFFLYFFSLFSSEYPNLMNTQYYKETIKPHITKYMLQLNKSDLQTILNGSSSEKIEEQIKIYLEQEIINITKEDKSNKFTKLIFIISPDYTQYTELIKNNIDNIIKELDKLSLLDILNIDYKLTPKMSTEIIEKMKEKDNKNFIKLIFILSPHANGYTEYINTNIDQIIRELNTLSMDTEKTEYSQLSVEISECLINENFFNIAVLHLINSDTKKYKNYIQRNIDLFIEKIQDFSFIECLFFIQILKRIAYVQSIFIETIINEIPRYQNNEKILIKLLCILILKSKNTDLDHNQEKKFQKCIDDNINYIIKELNNLTIKNMNDLKEKNVCFDHYTEKKILDTFYQNRHNITYLKIYKKIKKLLNEATSPIIQLVLLKELPFNFLQKKNNLFTRLKNKILLNRGFNHLSEEDQIVIKENKDYFETMNTDIPGMCLIGKSLLLLGVTGIATSGSYYLLKKENTKDNTLNNHFYLKIIAGVSTICIVAPSFIYFYYTRPDHLLNQLTCQNNLDKIKRVFQ